jgi:hypothetical protein
MSTSYSSMLVFCRARNHFCHKDGIFKQPKIIHDRISHDKLFIYSSVPTHSILNAEYIPRGSARRASRFCFLVHSERRETPSS